MRKTRRSHLRRAVSHHSLPVLTLPPPLPSPLPLPPLSRPYCQAVALVDDLTAKAVAALQLPRLPSDLELVPQLEQYVNQWAFGFQTLADLAATGRRLAATTGRKMK